MLATTDTILPIRPSWTKPKTAGKNDTAGLFQYSGKARLSCFEIQVDRLKDFSEKAMIEKNLTHLTKDGEVHMVDVGGKKETERIAIAEGWIKMSAETLELIKSAKTKKGDVLAVARIAGIMAAKKTSELIPLCHPLMLTNVDILLDLDESRQSVNCRGTARTTERTGVEMEALVAVQVALLTVYDMCKSSDRGMEISGVRLIRKAGGKSGEWNRNSAGH